MPTRPTHHRAKHRGRVRRFALPATVLCGLTLAAQWSQPFDAVLWSPVQAQGPSPAPRKVEPRIIDFAKLAKQKTEARRLLDAARKAAAKGDLSTARRNADQAAAIPVEWNLGETSPKKFLADLATDPARFMEAAADPNTSDESQSERNVMEIESSTSSATTAPEVIDLEFPKGRSSSRKVLDTDEAATGTSTTPKSLRSLGFKTSGDDAIVTESTTSKPQSKSRYATVPTVEELAAPASEATSSTASAKRSDAQSSSEAPAIQQLANHNAVIPSGRLEETHSHFGSSSSSSAPFAGLRSQSQGHDFTAAAPTTTTVIHEFRVAERTAPAADQTANASSSIASQLLLNINSLMMAGLFGALVLLVGVAVAVLRKFGPNPEFTFKVELNQPLGFAAAAASTVAAVAAPMTVEPVIRTPTQSVHVSPIYALKRQMAEELEQQQEDAMMRQVFEDNLKLREQIEETRIAA